MNRQYFFKRVRGTLFGGKLSEMQVDGMTRIIDYRDEKWPNMPDEELAYVLATVKWETAHTMQPIKERGSRAYLQSKRYYPWIGYGLVQLTWKENYAKFGVTENPDKALEWPTALDICFRGMIFGMFTGKKLADYIKPGRKPDYIGARRIINGTDKAKAIAGIADGFLDALRQSKEGASPVDTAIDDNEPVTTGKPLSKSTTVGAATGAGAAGTLAGPINEQLKQAAEAAETAKPIWEFASMVGPWVMGAIIIACTVWIIRERYLKSKQEGI